VRTIVKGSHWLAYQKRPSILSVLQEGKRMATNGAAIVPHRHALGLPAGSVRGYARAGCSRLPVVTVTADDALKTLQLLPNS
jgi:hypothetical protein